MILDLLNKLKQREAGIKNPYLEGTCTNSDQYMYTLNYGRRTGKTTAAKFLLENHGAFVIVPSFCMWNTWNNKSRVLTPEQILRNDPRFIDKYIRGMPKTNLIVLDEYTNESILAAGVLRERLLTGANGPVIKIVLFGEHL